MSTKSKLLTVKQVAEKMGLGVEVIRRYCRDGRLPADQIENHIYLIWPCDLREFMKIKRKIGRPKNSDKCG